MTKDSLINLLRRGIETGVVGFVTNPYTGQGTVCKMGNYYLYFAEEDARKMNPAQYLLTHDIEDTVKRLADELNAVLEEGMEKDYFVHFKMDARYVVRVSAVSPEQAIRRAESEYYDADFGPAEDIDGYAFLVEDMDGNYVWEK